MKVVYRLSTVARLLELKNRSAKRTCGYRLVLNWNLRYAMRTCRGLINEEVMGRREMR